jgi:hypothetical protein
MHQDGILGSSGFIGTPGISGWTAGEGSANISACPSDPGDLSERLALARNYATLQIARFQADLLGDFSREDDRAAKRKDDEGIEVDELRADADLRGIYQDGWGVRVLLQLSAVRRLFMSPEDPALLDLLEVASAGAFDAEYCIRRLREMLRASAGLPPAFVDALTPWPGSHGWRDLVAEHGAVISAALYAKNRKRRSIDPYRGGGGAVRDSQAPDEGLAGRTRTIVDPAAWTAEEAGVSRKLTKLSFRVPKLVHALCAAASARRGQTLSEFFRDSLALAAVQAQLVVDRRSFTNGAPRDTHELASALVREAGRAADAPVDPISWAQGLANELDNSDISERVTLSRRWDPGPKTTRNDVLAAIGAHLLHHAIVSGEFAQAVLTLTAEERLETEAPLCKQQRMRMVVPRFIVDRLVATGAGTSEKIRTIWDEYTSGRYDRALNEAGGFARGRHLCRLVHIFGRTAMQSCKTHVEPGLARVFEDSCARKGYARPYGIAASAIMSASLARLVATGLFPAALAVRRHQPAGTGSSPSIAADVLAKPVSFAAIAKMAGQAQGPDLTVQRRGAEGSGAADPFARLNPRSRQVLQQIYAGLSAIWRCAILLPTEPASNPGDPVIVLVAEGRFNPTQTGTADDAAGTAFSQAVDGRATRFEKVVERLGGLLRLLDDADANLPVAVHATDARLEIRLCLRRGHRRTPLTGDAASRNPLLPPSIPSLPLDQRDLHD